MQDKIRIKLLGNFAVFINEVSCDDMLNKTHKGIELIQFLMLHDGQPVPNQRLLATLWSEDKSSNPESALKTLISRTRAMLNQISPGFGGCIAADRGAYHWEAAEGMIIDVYEVQRIYDQLMKSKDDTAKWLELMPSFMEHYTGDLLAHGEQKEWALSRAQALHTQYLSVVYTYVEMLKAAENYKEVVNVCRAALDVDNFDDKLHIELMSALIKVNRTNEALVQYKHVVHLHYHYLGIQPSDEMQEFYKQIVRAGKTLDFSLDSIMNELRESGEQRDAFVCEYAVFKEIFNLQMRNLERLGSSMFLAVLMVTDINGQAMDPIKQDNIMTGLLEIMKRNLRKGDTITHFSPTIYAMLLPTVNYSTGTMVMERIKRLFYRMYPNSNVSFTYRLGPLASNMPEIDPRRNQI